METNQQQIQLGPNALEQFDYVSTRHSAKIQHGISPDEILKPAFWAHHALKLKPLDEIRAHAEDGTWLANYVVLDCSRTWAKVQLLSMHRLTTSDVSQTQASDIEVKAFIDAHEVKHRGPHAWSIVRRSDKAVLEQGIAVKDDAIAWLEKHAREQVGAPAAKAETVAA